MRCVAFILLLAFDLTASAIVVDAEKGSDWSGDGTSTYPYQTLQYALDVANSGATVTLRAGRYSGVCIDRTCNVKIVGTDYKTVVIDAGEYGYQGVANYGGGAVSVRGVTITGCSEALYGVSVINCVVSNNYCSLASNCKFYNCLIADNAADWDFQYFIENCELYGCTYANNRSVGYTFPGLSSSCRAYNTIVCGNDYDDGRDGNYESASSLTFCYTGDPRFVDAYYGDYRLRADSPCRDAGSSAYAETTVWSKALNNLARIGNGSPDIGCFEGGYVSGHVISTRAKGNGSWSPTYAIVQDGGSVTFTANCDGREIKWMTVDEVSVTPGYSYTFTGVSHDSILSAEFLPGNIYVDPVGGSDSRNGTSWATAKATIRAALAVVKEGEEVIVTNGVVKGSFTIPEGFTVRSVNGPLSTTIDLEGGHVEADWSSLLKGFTLTNGYGFYGGALKSVTAEDCILTGNSANWGGGAHYGTLRNCLVYGNRAVYGGSGVQNTTIHNCIISNNCIAATGTGWSIGAAVSAAYAYNCLIVENYGSTPGSFNTTGAANSHLFNCTVARNRLDGGVARASGANSCELYNTIVCENGSPGDGMPQHGEDRAVGRIFTGEGLVFEDSERGDYRLRGGTPCINAGDNGKVFSEKDLTGNDRIVRGTVDLGCYEYLPTNETQTITAPIPVEFDWVRENCPEALASVSGDFDAAVLLRAGNPAYSIWETYLADISPTDTNAEWHAEIKMVGNEPIVKAVPESPKRKYTVVGKEKLTDPEWLPNNDAARFFKVRVELK